MTNLLLKTKTENYLNGSAKRERKRERERERRRAQTPGGEFWEYILLYIRSLFSIQSLRTNCEQHSCLPEHVNMFI